MTAIKVVLQSGYIPPSSNNLNYILEGSARRLYASSFDASVLGGNSVSHFTRHIAVSPYSTADTIGKSLVRHGSRILKPNGFDLSKYVAPSAKNLNIKLSTNKSNPYLFGKLDVLGRIPAPRISLGLAEYLEPKGFYSQRTGAPNAILYQAYLNIISIPSTSELGIPSIESTTKEIRLSGFDAASIGISSVYNLKQFIPARQFNASTYGKPYLIGGVRWVYPAGQYFGSFGKTDALNTTGNQGIKPNGINSASIPKPDVSPRILYPKGFTLLSIGKPDIRSPVLIPKGLVHTQYGKTTVWYHTRLLDVNGILSFESGYPKIFDPTRFVTPAPLNRSAVFGDVAIANKSVFIKPISIFNEIVTPWAILENNRRYQKPLGIKSQAFGDIDVINKTPSIFVSSISTPAFSMPAIGYRIRLVKPSGFDSLNIGRSVLTKTPELLPKGLMEPVFNAPTVWYKNRIIDVSNNGVESFKSGVATAWFRYRYVTPKSWRSSSFSAQTITHGVRGVGAKGFLRDTYGNAWVSQGTRLIEPTSIYKEFIAKHMVGGTRYVSPDGYIATQWGTRIIPESQLVRPLGFAGKLGQASVGLYTRYLRPTGYISVGKQPADRWGVSKLYSKRQYITQVFDNTSGLVPPKWSEWQSIQNRNRRIGATGFNSQKFGYSQISNNASPLLAKSIAPPFIGGGMISSSDRLIGLQGIVPPLIGTWSVVYNAARVVRPQSNIQTLMGVASANNTRRYYDRVGRIESQELGEPMISFRVRTIDVEKRYSIAPPIIRLPAIDNLTKHVSFRGYETTAYGLPSLAIRFNIIAPKWIHRDSIGNPKAHNVTPELGLFGHNSQAFGLPVIRTQWRTIQMFGDKSTLFGRHKIADSKQNIIVRGWLDTSMSKKYTVKGSGAPPYTEQRISLDGYMNYSVGDGEYIEGYGIYFDEKLLGKRVPKPGLNQNVLYAEGMDSSIFGVTNVHSNNIQVTPGIAIHNISKGTTVYNKSQIVTLTEEDAIKSDNKMGEPRLSPWTIYAVVEAPKQARDNHKYMDLHVVDGSRYSNTYLGKIGKPKIDNKHRSIAHKGFIDNQCGYASVQSSLRIIAPKSFNARKVGLPSIPFTLQSIVVFNDSKFFTLWGKPSATIKEELNRGLLSRSFNSQSFGTTEIQMLNRAITTKGHSSQAMGARKQNDKPYMWQGLRVGEHVPMSIGAGMTALYGDTMISLRVREINLEGFNAFASEYDTSNFNARMTVTRNRVQGSEPQRITTQGFNNQELGYPSVKYGQQFIKPDGNSDQFRKGGYHA